MLNEEAQLGPPPTSEPKYATYSAYSELYPCMEHTMVCIRYLSLRTQAYFAPLHHFTYFSYDVCAHNTRCACVCGGTCMCACLCVGTKRICACTYSIMGAFLLCGCSSHRVRFLSSVHICCACACACACVYHGLVYW